MEAPSTAIAVPLPLGWRLFVSSIITRIGRENKLSADIFLPANSPLGTKEKSASGFVLFSVIYVKCYYRALNSAVLKIGAADNNAVL